LLLATFAGPGVRPASHDPTALWLDGTGARFVADHLARYRDRMSARDLDPALWEAMERAVEPAARERAPFWGDDVDFDLLRAVPGAVDALGDLAGRELRGHGGVSRGRLNGLAAWNDGDRFTGFVSIDPSHAPTPPPYVSRDPVVTFTFEELWRDAWSHSVDAYCLGQRLVNGGDFVRAHMDVMYAIRGWSSASPRHVVAAESRTLRSIRRSVELLRWLLGAWEARPVSGPGRRLEEVQRHHVGHDVVCGLCRRPVAPTGDAVYLWRCARCWKVGCGDCVAGAEGTCACPRLEAPRVHDSDAASDDIPF
jgi:hypothetical protein